MGLFRFSAIAVVAVASISVAHAADITWNTTGSNNNSYTGTTTGADISSANSGLNASLNCTNSATTCNANAAGNERTFTSNGISISARAFSVVSSTTQTGTDLRLTGGLQAAYLAIYGSGLGVNSGNEVLSNSPAHTVDNNNTNSVAGAVSVTNLSEMVIFQFGPNVSNGAVYNPVSVLLAGFSGAISGGGTTGTKNITYLIGNDTANITKLSDFTGKSLQSLIDAGFQRCDDTTNSSTVSLNGTQAGCTPTSGPNSGNRTGKYLIIAPLLTGNTDDFKITSITGAVPEPSTIALLGIGALGFYYARRRRA